SGLASLLILCYLRIRRAPPSFPTRRSSDLGAAGRLRGLGGRAPPAAARPPAAVRAAAPGLARRGPAGRLRPLRRGLAGGVPPPPRRRRLTPAAVAGAPPGTGHDT